MLWWQWSVLAIIIGFVAAAIYSAITYTEAVLEVKSSPREPMYECEKHGLIRKKHLILFMKKEDGTDMEWCPFCFDERLKVNLDSSVTA